MQSRLRQLLQITAVLCLVAGVARAQTAVSVRAPLLQDGAFLTRVQGTLEPGEGGKAWGFRLRDAYEGEPDRVMALLPSVTLEDMIRRHNALTNGDVARFELSARVTTYRGINCALPLFATPISAFAQRPARPVLRPPGAVDGAGVVMPSEPLDDYVPTAANVVRDHPFGIRWVPLLPQARLERERALAKGGDVRADDVEQGLLDAVGDVQRSADAPMETIRAEEAARGTPSVGSIDPISGRPWLAADRSVQERHGVVTRDPVTGEWRFVFESSRGALGAREATLLPCALLERLERQARSTVGPLTVVISGEITRFDGRAYMLPSSFAVPRTGKTLGR